MSKLENQSSQSIHDYLDFPHRIWTVEFDISDFGASLTSLLELPLQIYSMDCKTFFWSFMKQFLQNCQISFILRKYDSVDECIELALIGFWENQQIAIPLWILNENLLGFEIITLNFTILDSETLFWNSPSLSSNQSMLSLINNEKEVILAEDIFENNKIYFKISNAEITLSDFNELEFFERIAQTIIPELDENEKE